MQRLNAENDTHGRGPTSSSKKARPIAFVWDNFGPMHVDRCEAVAARFVNRREVIGIEIGTKSATYLWDNESGKGFRKITVFPGQAAEERNAWDRFSKTLKVCLDSSSSDFFFCHYDHISTLLTAATLRMLGRNVFAMGCSKFDDYSRSLPREIAKYLFYVPYQGGLSSGLRARDYMRFLGLRAQNIRTEYNTVSLDRIRSLAGAPPAPDGLAFGDRHFSIIARLVPKKNIALALKAFSLLVERGFQPRSLHIFGSGPLEQELKSYARDLGIADKVHFRGFVQTDAISRALATSLSLLLPSIEEQFGNVVIESLAMGVPVLISENCGARDLLVRAGVNGFVFEPDNAEGLAFFMNAISEDEALWRKLCAGAAQLSARGDVARFADGVEALVDGAGQ